MKYYRESLAYDFNRFMPREEKVQDNIISLNKVQPKKRTRAAAKPMNLSAFAVAVAVMMLAAMCGNIFLRLQINEVNTQINEMESKIELLNSEKTALEVELEGRLSYTNIEKEAADLGMRKMNKEQVKYIRVNDTDVAYTVDAQAKN